MNNVIIGLNAIASTIDKGNTEQEVVKMYEIAYGQLKSSKEKKALKFGMLAVMADIGRMRIRRWYYTRKFKKAMEALI